MLRGKYIHNNIIPGYVSSGMLLFVAVGSVCSLLCFDSSCFSRFAFVSSWYLNGEIDQGFVESE